MSHSPVVAIKNLGFPWETSDPFLFCVHHADAYPSGNAQMGPSTSLAGRNLGNDFVVKDGFRMYHGQTVPGFPAHPHRGFETVTVVLEGLVDHSDSIGAAGRFGDGDTQWMTAGKGVQHCEMFPLLDQEGPNPLELFQIWLNLPKANKFVEPHFKMLWGEHIPKVSLKDSVDRNIEITVIAGSIADQSAPTPPPDSWANDPQNEVAIWSIKMDAGATWYLPPASAGLNRTIYFFKGESLHVAEQYVAPYKAVVLRSDEQVLLENGDKDARILLLQGRPINEPIAKYGPFVMNTETEIREAMLDFHRTQFGGWPWPSNDHVHPREKGRFAKHADGRLEEK